MRVHVVSDVHGNAEALAKAGEGADALFVLGDLIDFLDYHDPSRGVLADVLGQEAGHEVARLRAVGRPGEMGAFVGSLWEGIDDPRDKVREAVREQYGRLFGALADIGVPTWLTPGNVDVPALWPEFDAPGVTVVDGGVVEVGGLRVGFVGGVPLPPGIEPRAGVFSSYMRRADDFDAAVAGLEGPIDLLCSHAPPGVTELAYDVVARNHELSSPALLAAIHRHRPRAALFGHVHAPLATRVRVGVTECVNVGHFQRRGHPCVLRW